MCVFSPVQAKSKTEQCQLCAFNYSRARKRERECYNYMCVQFSVGLRQWIHICVHMYILVCVCVRQRVHICVTVSMCRQGVGVRCVLVCRRPWMLSRLQLGTGMVHVQCRKDINLHLGQQQHEQQGGETHTSCLAVNQNRKYKVFFRFIWILTFFRWIVIYIRLVWFQRRVTILFTVFKLAQAPLTRTLRATAATKYSMHVLPLLPPHPQEGVWSKASKQNEQHQQNCNTEQQKAQQNTLWRCILGACYQWLSWTISLFFNYVPC